MNADLAQHITRLASYSTPTVLNGLKRLGVPTAELQTMDRSAVHCMSPSLGVHVGFAVTRSVSTRRSGPPADQAKFQEQEARLHQIIASLPGPRILVVENIGEWAGPVCIWGQVTATLNVAMGCTVGITNGPVRDLVEMEQVGFQTFASGLDTGGGVVDAVAVGEPVEIGGVTIATGDLIHADRHGVARIPPEHAAGLAEAIEGVLATESRVMAVARRPGFTAADVARAWAGDDQADSAGAQDSSDPQGNPRRASQPGPGQSPFGDPEVQS
jgi:regulator of RNase E activity RraA